MSKKDNNVEQSRRTFLKSAGKVAVFTTPAMMMVSKPSYATFQKTGGDYCEIDSSYTNFFNWYHR